jgi:putative transposase
MSAVVSPTTGRPYGVALVCRVWDVPRSTYYAQAPGEAAEAPKPKRRGPRPKISDEALLAAIQRDLERSPFVGEGHRKVHARLRVLDKIRVSRTRTLRLMRENNLLSPHRSRQGEKKVHNGTIITDEPNVMWGTDGAKVFTLDDGWVWTFATVEHWNAECVGWHVCKHGSRFNALEAVKMGVEKHFGSVDGDVARGLSLRMDHGSQYIRSLPKPDPLLGHHRVLGLRRGATNERRRGAIQPDPQGAGDLRPNLPQRRRGQNRRAGVHRTLQSRVVDREDGIPQPRSGAP